VRSAVFWRRAADSPSRCERTYFEEISELLALLFSAGLLVAVRDWRDGSGEPAAHARWCLRRHGQHAEAIGSELWYQEPALMTSSPIAERSLLFGFWLARTPVLKIFSAPNLKLVPRPTSLSADKCRWIRLARSSSPKSLRSQRWLKVHRAARAWRPPTANRRQHADSAQI